jgi:uncharacterized protein (DUF2252 family)
VGEDMKDSASQAQYYHDLALEFLVLARFTTTAAAQEGYHMMGEHYLAKASAELARAKLVVGSANLEAPNAQPELSESEIRDSLAA